MEITHKTTFPFGVHKGRAFRDVPAWWIKEVWEERGHPIVCQYYEKYKYEIEAEVFKHFNRDYIMYFDGCCEPKNPYGQMGWGCYIEHAGKWVYHSSNRRKAGFENSNNVAEYLALLDGLKWFLDQDLAMKSILVRGDSALVVNQMNKEWGFGKNGLYLQYGLEAKDIFDVFTNIQIEWIPREMNDECDYLSKMSLL